MLINYIQEHQARIEYSIDEGLTSSEWLLWEALYYLFNQRSKASSWPDGFIRIPNKRLLAVVPLQYDAMATARNKLKQRGVIDYVQGRKNTDPPMYKLNYLTAPQAAYQDDLVDEPVDNYVDNLGYPEKTDNLPGNPPDNLPGNIPGKPPYKPANIYPNLTYPNVSQHNKEEEEDERARAGDALPPQDPDYSAKIEAMTKTVKKAILNNFGHAGTPGIVSRLALMLTGNDFSRDMATLLIEQAALHQARDLWGYAVMTLNDWSNDDIRTPDEFSARQYLLDLQAGKMDGMHHNVTDELEQLRRKRKEDHQSDGR